MCSAVTLTVLNAFWKTAVGVSMWSGEPLIGVRRSVEAKTQIRSAGTLVANRDPAYARSAFSVNNHYG